MSLSNLCQPQSHVQSPSLENQNALQWERHAQLAYCFARHARHDLANIHCALGMLEMVEQIQKDYPEMPLPDELNPEMIRIKTREDIKKVTSISNDLIMLNQAAALPPYQISQTTNLAKLIQQNIVDRLDGKEQIPEQLLTSTIDTPVVTMGEMLGTALAVMYCQWTPWSHTHENAALSTVTHGAGMISLHIPSDEDTMLTQFATQLASSSDEDPLTIPLEQSLTTTTGTMALWLARHIIIVHGGNVSIDPNDPSDSLTVTLPVVM